MMMMMIRVKQCNMAIVAGVLYSAQNYEDRSRAGERTCRGSIRRRGCTCGVDTTRRRRQVDPSCVSESARPGSLGTLTRCWCEVDSRPAQRMRVNCSHRSCKTISFFVTHSLVGSCYLKRCRTGLLRTAGPRHAFISIQCAYYVALLVLYGKI